MTYAPPPAPAGFLPPAPPARSSRAGGLILLLGGFAAVGALWLPGVSFMDESITYFDMYKMAGGTGDLGSAGDQLQLFFYAMVGGGGLAALLGLIAVISGGKGANLTAGILGIFAAGAAAFPPAKVLIESDFSFEGFGIGYYASLGAPVLILIGVLAAFIGAGKR